MERLQNAPRPIPVLPSASQLLTQEGTDGAGIAWKYLAAFDYDYEDDDENDGKLKPS